jgi:hypothetical protein
MPSPTSSPSRDEYASPTEAAPRVAPSRLFWGKNIGPTILIGRENVIQALDAAWFGPKRKQVVTIVAWGGVGKTSVVAHWAARQLAEPEHGTIDAYFDWSFYSQGTFTESDSFHARKAVSADLFFKAALEFFGDPQLASSAASSTRKAERLAQLVGNCRSLVTLDGLESLQDSTTGELLDDGVRVLLRGLAAHNQGLCLVTTRKHLPELNTWRETTALELELAKLTKADGARLLENLGVTGTPEELRLLTEDLKGHALTLTLLGKYLVEAHNGDIRKRDTVSLTEADYAETSGHAFRVIEAYEAWLDRDGGKVEASLLRLLGLFNRPATPDSLAALRATPPIPGLTDLLVSATPAQWNTAIKRLVRMGLIEEQPWEPPRVAGYSKEQAEAVRSELGFRQDLKLPKPKLHRIRNSSAPASSSLDTHPLIRDYFHQRLRETDITLLAHRRLFDQLRNSVPYWPEGLEGIQPLYNAVANGCRAGLYEDAAETYQERIQRTTSGRHSFYSEMRLGAVSANLATFSNFFTTPWTHLASGVPNKTAAWVLGEASRFLRALGRLAEAREPMLASIKLFKELDIWEGIAVTAHNFSELELALSNIPSAIHAAARSIQFSERTLNSLWRVASIVQLAYALHHAGRLFEASDIYGDAQQLQANVDGASELYSVNGFKYNEFLLASTESAAWRVRLGLALQRDTKFGPKGAEHLGIRASFLTSGESADEYPFPIPGFESLCIGIAARATDSLGSNLSGFSAALDHLTLGRLALYQAILEPSSFDIQSSELDLHLDACVDGLRQSANLDELPGGLLTRALLRAVRGELDRATSDLAEAQQLAERAPLPLFLADVALHRARLIFREDLAGAREDLRRARDLIEKHGYLRRLHELEDAESVILVRSAATS